MAKPELNIVHQKPRRADRLLLALAPREGTTSPMARFARSIVERHGQALGWIPALALEFLAPPDGTAFTSPVWQQALNVHVRPTIQLNVLRPAASLMLERVHLQNLSKEPDRITTRERIEKERKIHQENLSERLHRLETRLTQRHREMVTIVRRSTNLGEVDSSAEPSLESRQLQQREARTIAPVARVVTRSAASPTAATGRQAPSVGSSSSPESTIPATSTSFTAPGQASSPSPIAAASMPVHVRQLTDQVVRAIDQRILARRERLGRI